MIPPEIADVIDRVRAEKLTYLKPRYLRDIAEAVIEADRARRPGAIIEAGAALGGSAIVMARAKAPERTLLVYDAFATIPPPSDKDGEDVHRRYAKIEAQQAKGIGGEIYYGYRDDLLSEVTQSFKQFDVPVEASNVELIKGYFDETIHLAGPVALAHLDGDWYESTRTCLERIEPHLVPGGRMIIDDYYKWSGCQSAIDEYFAGRSGYDLVKHGRLHIIKRESTLRRLWSRARRSTSKPVTSR